MTRPSFASSPLLLVSSPLLLVSSPLLLVSLLSLTACAGSQPQPAEPKDPPLLEQPAEEEQAPSSPEVKRAVDLIKEEKYAEAEAVLESAVADAPEDPQAAFFYGVALERVGKASEAEAQYARAVELTPSLIEASQNLSALLLDQERFEEALRVTEAALELAPKDSALLANRAIALDMLERPEAIGAYEQLLELAPDDAANRFNYAVVLYLNERLKDAQAQLGRIETTDLSLLADMERLYLEMKDADGCIALWSRALQGGKSAAALARRGRCKLMKEDLQGAEADLRAAIEAEPKAAIGHFYLGKLLETQGKTALAKEAFEAAAKAEPESGIGRAAAAELQKAQ